MIRRPTPSWRATREMTVLSWGSWARSSWTIFTARSFNSGGYLFVVGRFSAMTPSSLPRYGVSGDPRPVQLAMMLLLLAAGESPLLNRIRLRRVPAQGDHQREPYDQCETDQALSTFPRTE